MIADKGEMTSSGQWYSNDLQPIPDRKQGYQDRFAYVRQAEGAYIFLLNLSLEQKSEGESGSERESKNTMPRTSSSGVKSFTMLNSFRISSGVLPLIMLATVLHPTSLRDLSENREHCVFCRVDAQQRLDVEVVGGQDDFKKHLLINCDKLLVPFANIGCPLSVLVRVCFVGGWQRLATMVLAVLQNLCEKCDQTRTSAYVTQKLLTFFSTDEATLGSGIGWSLSPTSIDGQGGKV